MPIAKAWSVILLGIDGRVIEIEADLGGGLSHVTRVGLPDAGLREAKDRVRSAVRNSGRPWPDGTVTLGLSPANLPKVDSAYDLGIAAAVLAATGAVPATRWIADAPRWALRALGFTCDPLTGHLAVPHPGTVRRLPARLDGDATGPASSARGRIRELPARPMSLT
jgi:hypothetical protein